MRYRICACAARRRSVGQPVAPVRLHERETRLQRHLADVVTSVDLARVLAFRDDRAVRNGCEEAADSSARRADALAEGALRHQLNLQFATEDLPFEFTVLAPTYVAIIFRN